MPIYFREVTLNLPLQADRLVSGSFVIIQRISFHVDLIEAVSCLSWKMGGGR
ncbi:hypothetical protein [Ekhidna sp.]